MFAFLLCVWVRHGWSKNRFIATVDNYGYTETYDTAPASLQFDVISNVSFYWGLSAAHCKNIPNPNYHFRPLGKRWQNLVKDYHLFETE